MSPTVWANLQLRPGAREMLAGQLDRLGCRFIQSEKSSRFVLTEGEPDSALAEADIAYGQPVPDDVMGNPRLKWVALSTAGYMRFDCDDFRAAMRARHGGDEHLAGVRQPLRGAPAGADAGVHARTAEVHPQPGRPARVGIS